ncbi:MAG: hypothetical protein Q9170_008160 [Blastenia crenularia]
MRALHLPGLSVDKKPPFAFPSPTLPPSALVYTDSDYPTSTIKPKVSGNSQLDPQPSYLVRVSHTALTRGELTWEETLKPSRFKEHGGAIPGHDLIGSIEEIYSPSVQGEESVAEPPFRVGDKVAALLAFDRDGAAADYTLAEGGELAHVPAGMDDERLATVPLSGLSAWQALLEHGGLLESRFDQPGSSIGEEVRTRVLVTGASGSVGVMATQIAKAAGCFVIGTCSSRNVEFVKHFLGADEVVDYTRVSSLMHGFEEAELEPVDIVVDTVGKRTLLETMDPRIVKDNARVVSLASPLKAAASGAEETGKAFEGRGGKFTFFVVRPDGEQLAKLIRLVKAEQVRGFVDRVESLSSGTEAMERVETGRSRGKVVLQVAQL